IKVSGCVYGLIKTFGIEYCPVVNISALTESIIQNDVVIFNRRILNEQIIVSRKKVDAPR
ncbi:hypothetical protein, partial [Klebsiella pneumoniae]|uniref:hypothetical protein n=1 Tax=Klebsiella pneumoniae TaxID=573 RepID=UPI002FF0AC80